MDAHQDRLRGLMQEVWQLQADLDNSEASIIRIRDKLSNLYADVDDAMDKEHLKKS